MKKVVGSGDPDPHQKVTDPQHWKLTNWQNTVPVLVIYPKMVACPYFCVYRQIFWPAARVGGHGNKPPRGRGQGEEVCDGAGQGEAHHLQV